MLENLGSMFRANSLDRGRDAPATPYAAVVAGGYWGLTRSSTGIQRCGAPQHPCTWFVLHAWMLLYFF